MAIAPRIAPTLVQINNCARLEAAYLDALWYKMCD